MHVCCPKRRKKQLRKRLPPAVVKVEHETRRYSTLLKNSGARLLNMGLEKSQTHSYPAHTVNKCCMLLSVILFLYSYRSTVSGKMSHLARTFTFSSWICALHTSLLIIVAGTLRRSAGSLTRSAGTPYRLVPAHFYHWPPATTITISAPSCLAMLMFTKYVTRSEMLHIIRSFITYIIIDTDINECVRNNGGCHSRATCANTYGSFTCTCQQGYTGDGINCTGNQIYERSISVIKVCTLRICVVTF